MTEEQNTNATPLISLSALALPLASGIAYGMAVLYELGYAETYGIPRGVISISLNDFLRSMLTCGLWVVFCWIWLAGAVAIASRTTHRWGWLPWAFAGMTPPVLSVALVIWLAGYGWYATAILGAFCLGTFMFVAEEVFPKAHQQVTEWPMLAKFREIVETPFEPLRRYFGRYAGTALIILVLTGAFVLLLGKRQARYQNEYLAVQEIPGYVLLRTYGDRVVLGSYNANSRTIGESIRILEWSDLSDKTLIRKNRSDLLTPFNTYGKPMPGD